MSKSNISSSKKPKEIYLDYAASVGANPSSIHTLGINARKNLENARLKVANILSARPSEIIFTSGGTESNNLAIQGVAFAQFFSPYVRPSRIPRSKKFEQMPHIVTTNIEHPSVLDTFKLLEKRKLAEISIVPVEPNGIIDPKKIKKAIKKNTILVSVMYANNEIGTIQPIREIAKEIRHWKKGKEIIFSVPPSLSHSKIISFPFFHTDAVQAVNYLDLNVEKLGVDLLSISGSKIEGAGRVGVLYKRKTVSLAPLYGGGDQEMGLRPGTENLEAIIKFSSALVEVQKTKDKEVKRLTQLRDYFITKIFKNVTNPAIAESLTNSEIILNGDRENRLPNNVNVTFSKIPSDLLVIELSARGIMTSSKSACKSSHAEGSYVIKAIHPEIDSEIGGVRFSLGRATTKKDIDYVIKSLSQILTKLKKWYDM